MSSDAPDETLTAAGAAAFDTDKAYVIHVELEFPRENLSSSCCRRALEETTTLVCAALEASERGDTTLRPTALAAVSAGLFTSALMGMDEVRSHFDLFTCDRSAALELASLISRMPRELGLTCKLIIELESLRNAQANDKGVISR